MLLFCCSDFCTSWSVGFARTNNFLVDPWFGFFWLSLLKWLSTVASSTLEGIIPPKLMFLSYPKEIFSVFNSNVHQCTLCRGYPQPFLNSLRLYPSTRATQGMSVNLLPSLAATFYSHPYCYCRPKRIAFVYPKGQWSEKMLLLNALFSFCLRDFSSISNNCTDVQWQPNCVIYPV